MKKRLSMLMLFATFLLVGIIFHSIAGATEEGIIIDVENQIVTGTCGAEGDNLTWEFDPTTGVLTISGTGDMVFSPSWNETYKNQISSVTILEGVTSIGVSAFEGCTGLTSVTIPDGVVSIGHRAFYGCTGLSSLTIPPSVTSIGNFAFGSCKMDLVVDENNQSYSSDSNGGLFNKEKTVLIQADGLIGSPYDIPEGVITIEDFAFYGCKDLYSVTIPSSVTEIGSLAFVDCPNLNEIKFYGDAPAIDLWAFGDTGGRYGGTPVSATVYYPVANETWTTEVMQEYGGEPIWEGFYRIIGNEQRSWSHAVGGDLSIEMDGPFSQFERVSIMGVSNEIAIDSGDYTVSELDNGTVVTFREDYLTTLLGAYQYTITFHFADGKATVGLTTEPKEYKVLLEGDYFIWNPQEGGDLSIFVYAPYAELDGVQIENTRLTEEQYTVVEGEGGTVVTIHEDYLKTQGLGGAHIVVSFTEGYAVAVLLVDIPAPPSPPMGGGEYEPTTEEPTTEEPTTEEPTTEESTTEEPTTEEPTTEEPTTEEPTTEEPTTEEPTTEEPATEEPTTEEPTTEEPTTEEPTTEEPTTEEPITEEPTTEELTTEESTTEEPTTEEPTTEEPATEEPTTEEPTTEESTTEEPTVGEDQPSEPDQLPTTENSDGWTEIAGELEQSGSGENILVEMNGAVIVPSDIVGIGAGKDIQISFDMGNGFVWEANGKDIPEHAGHIDLNLGVSDDTQIPKEMIKELANGRVIKEIELSHSGAFEFRLYLKVALGKDFAGHKANLYYYNEEQSVLELVASVLIDADGEAALPYDHASSYVIVIDEKNDTLPNTGDMGVGTVWKTLLVLSAVVFVGFAYAEKKRTRVR